MASLLWSMGRAITTGAMLSILLLELVLLVFVNFAAWLAGAPPIRRIARAGVGEKGNNGMYFGADGIHIPGLCDNAARRARINLAKSPPLRCNWGLQSSFLQSRRAEFTWSSSGM